MYLDATDNQKQPRSNLTGLTNAGFMPYVILNLHPSYSTFVNTNIDKIHLYS